MTSLSDVYEGRVGLVANRRRLYLGSVLLVAGAGMLVAAILVATTGLGSVFGLGTYEARELAGVLAGLGLPAGILGIFAVLPTGRTTRAAAAIGASLAVLGVALFRHAYPYNWVGATSPSPDLTLPVSVVYLAGTLTTTWCLFVAVATLKRRNDPGGTVRMEVTEDGGTRIVEVSGSPFSGTGGVGLVGDGPDGEVDTQTNQEPAVAPSTPASDGGSAAATGGDPADAEVLEATQTRGQPDAYCGNCAEFEYVRVDGDIEPHCGLRGRVMDDMDACEDWTANH